MLLDPSFSSQLLVTNADEMGYNLDEDISKWGSEVMSSLDSPQLTQASSQEVSHSPSLTPESIQSRAEVVSPGSSDIIICYGMVCDHKLFLREF